MIDLSERGPGPVQDLTVNDINGKGQVVGGRVPSGAIRAYMWTGGDPVDLTMDSSEALAVNDNGQVAGRRGAPGSGGSHAVFWSAGTMVDLGTLGGETSEGLGLNERGQVVGFAKRADGEQHASVWEQGVLTGLGLLASFVNLSLAVDVNNQGLIVGGGDVPSGSRHAVIWRRETRGS